MEKKEEIKIHPVVENLRKIMRDRKLTQATMAQYAQTTPSQFSKILNGSVQISIWQLSNIATALDMREIDIYTYPHKFIDPQELQRDNSVKATLSIELSADKKDQVLKLVFGENNLEIFNK